MISSRLARANAWCRHLIGQGLVHRGDLAEVFPMVGPPGQIAGH